MQDGIVPIPGKDGSGNPGGQQQQTSPGSTGNINPGQSNNPPAGGDKSQQTQAPTFTIDPRFQGLPPQEAIARTHQAVITPLHQKIATLEESQKKWTGQLDNLAQLTENKDLRMAFIRELEPDLIKAPDVDSQVEEKIKKKWGDFKPNREEADSDYFSDSAKYYRDIEKFRTQSEKDTEKFSGGKTFAELKEEIEKNKKSRQETSKKEQSDLKAKYNIDDNQFKIFFDWGKNLALEDLYVIYKGLSSNQQTNIRDITGVGGSALSFNEKQEKVNALFGGNRS